MSGELQRSGEILVSYEPDENFSPRASFIGARLLEEFHEIIDEFIVSCRDRLNVNFYLRPEVGRKAPAEAGSRKKNKICSSVLDYIDLILDKMISLSHP